MNTTCNLTNRSRDICAIEFTLYCLAVSTDNVFIHQNTGKRKKNESYKKVNHCKNNKVFIHSKCALVLK